MNIDDPLHNVPSQPASIMSHLIDMELADVASLRLREEWWSWSRTPSIPSKQDGKFCI